jgi:hypothetical protein
MTALALTGGAWESPARRFHDDAVPPPVAGDSNL